MNDEDLEQRENGDDPYEEAKALRESIAVIRRAQGKAVPSDFPDGSDEWLVTALDFLQDIDRLFSSKQR
jgi:hypothetical protein